MQLPFDLGPLWRKDDRFSHFQEDIVQDGKSIQTQWISFQLSDLNGMDSLVECLDADDSSNLGVMMRIFDPNNTVTKFENLAITVSLKDENNNLVSTQSYLDTSRDFYNLSKIMKHQLKIAMATEVDMNFLSECRFKSFVDANNFEVVRSPRANSEFSDRSENKTGFKNFENLRVASSESSTSIASTSSSTSIIIPKKSNKYEKYTFELKIVFNDQSSYSDKLKWYLFVATKINFEPMISIPRSETLEIFKNNYFKHKYIPLSTFSNTAINQFCYKRFDTPVRFRNCNHVECCDISDFMEMNTNNLIPMCPVCKKLGEWSEVAVCDWTAKILDKSGDDEHKVLLNYDGSFVSPLNSTDCYGSDCGHSLLLKKPKLN